MKSKFTMGLVWHNCKIYPPKERWNANLYATNGRYVFKVAYDCRDGWFDALDDWPLPTEELHEYWWADLEHTIQTSKEFALIEKGENNEDL